MVTGEARPAQAELGLSALRLVDEENMETVRKRQWRKHRRDRALLGQTLREILDRSSCLGEAQVTGDGHDHRRCDHALSVDLANVVDHEPFEILDLAAR